MKFNFLDVFKKKPILDKHISKNFLWTEFKVSAERPDIAAKIIFTQEQRQNLFSLVTTVTQPIRDFLNEYVTVLSGVRSPELNTVIGGSSTSDHMIGAANDITSTKIVLNPKEIAYEIWELNLPIKQLIYYPQKHFIHLSINTINKPFKHELLRYENGNYFKEK